MDTVEHAANLSVVSVCFPDAVQEKGHGVAWDVRRVCPWARVEEQMADDACVLVLIVCKMTFSDKNCAAAVRDAMHRLIPILAVSVEGYDKKAAAGALGGLPVLDVRSSRYFAALHEFFASAVVDEKLVRAVAAAQARQNSAAATIADLYLMGLGALEGIGCERDCKRGCDMILASTLAGLLDAKKQLAFMYRFGKGVARDPQSAAKWTQDALVQARAAFEKDPSRENTLELAGVYGFLASSREEAGELDKARECYEQLCELWRDRDAGQLAASSAQIARVTLAAGGDAREESARAVEDALAYEKQGGSAENRERMCDLCRGLVALYEKEDDLAGAEVYAAHLDEVGKENALYELRTRFLKKETAAGDAALEKKDCQTARAAFDRAVAVCESILKADGAVDFEDTTAYFKDGFLAQREGRLDDAYRLYNRYSDVFGALYRKKQEAERIAREKAEQEEAERIAREKAEREEAERIARKKAEAEEAERIAREKAEREEAERIAREKAEREEAERIAREKAEREEAERIAREKAEREEAERIAREKAEAEEAERIAREKAEVEEAERIAREQAETEKSAQPATGFAAAAAAVRDFASDAAKAAAGTAQAAPEAAEIAHDFAADAAEVAAAAAKEAAPAKKRGLARVFGGLRKNFAAIMAREDDEEEKEEPAAEPITRQAADPARPSVRQQAAQIAEDIVISDEDDAPIEEPVIEDVPLGAEESFDEARIEELEDLDADPDEPQMIEDEPETDTFAEVPEETEETEETEAPEQAEEFEEIEEVEATEESGESAEEPQELSEEADDAEEKTETAEETEPEEPQKLEAAQLLELSKTASNYAKMAAALEAGGNLERAMNWCAESFKIRRDVYRASGSSVARAALGESVLMRARLLEKMGDANGAAADYADVVKLLAPLAANNEILSDAVAGAYLGHGRCAENAEAVRAAISLWTKIAQETGGASYEGKLAEAHAQLEKLS